MKKYYLFVGLILVLASCGGGGASAPNGATVDLTVKWPAALAGLDTKSYKIYGSLTEEETIIISDVKGELNGAGYVFSFEETAEGNYLFRLKFNYNSDFGEVDLASAQKVIDLVSGEQALTFSEADFIDIGGGDADGDLLDNLTELNMGLNPFLSDTDGDGIPDGADMFPSLAGEWLDTDGDGIGDNSDEDIDGDGLNNDEELGVGTDIYKVDTDDDGVGDAEDNCKLGANSDQLDTDGDGFGNACDGDSDGDGLSNGEEANLGTNPLATDTDGDGLADKYEVDKGLNPISADTDGDGYSDKEDVFPLDKNEWIDTDGDGVGDGSDNCKNVSNKDQKNTDDELVSKGYQVDADNLGDACDDDIDGNGLDIVFVDASRGSDDNLGTFNAPVKTIAKGIMIAYQRNEDVYVAGGSYDLSGVTYKNGVDLYGGFGGATFDLLTNERDIRSDDQEYCTYLTNSASSVTLHLDQDDGTFVVEGFHIINQADAQSSTVVKLEGSKVFFRGNTVLGNEGADFSIGLHVIGGSPKIDANWIDGAGLVDGTSSKGALVESGNPILTNNIIVAGRSRHTVALEIDDSAAKIVNNTLDGTSYANVPNTSSSFVFENSNPVAVNNIIVAGTGGESGDAVAMKCFGTSPDSAEFKNNIFSTFTTQTSDALVLDCNGQFYYSAAFTVGDATVAGNIAYEGVVGGLLDGGYGLAGTFGVDQGIPTNISEYGMVVKDFNMNDRQGSYDIGAKEK